MNETNFFNNKADRRGGAIYSSNSNFRIQNLLSSSNEADIGGFLSYEIFIPQFILDNKAKDNNNNNKFKNNSAFLYGQNFGSFLENYDILDNLN